MKKILYVTIILGLLGFMVGCSSTDNNDGEVNLSDNETIALSLMVASESYLNEGNVIDENTDNSEELEDFSPYFDLAELIINNALLDLETVSKTVSTDELYSDAFTVTVNGVLYKIDYNIDEENNIDGIASILTENEEASISYPVSGWLKSDSEKNREGLKLDISLSDTHTISILSGTKDTNEKLIIRENNNELITSTRISIFTRNDNYFVKIVTNNDGEKNVYLYHNSEDNDKQTILIDYELEDGTKGFLKRTITKNESGEDVIDYEIIENRGFIFGKSKKRIFSEKSRNFSDRIREHVSNNQKNHQNNTEESKNEFSEQSKQNSKETCTSI